MSKASGSSLTFRRSIHSPTPSFRTEQADAFSFHSAPAEWSACAVRNLSYSWRSSGCDESLFLESK
jgi:hypothetical protein